MEDFLNTGCVISHESFMCAILGVLVAVNLIITLKTKEITRLLNYIPLAHMFGCGTIVAVTYLGMSIDRLIAVLDTLAYLA